MPLAVLTPILPFDNLTEAIVHVGSSRSRVHARCLRRQLLCGRVCSVKVHLNFGHWMSPQGKYSRQTSFLILYRTVQSWDLRKFNIFDGFVFVLPRIWFCLRSSSVLDNHVLVSSVTESSWDPRPHCYWEAPFPRGMQITFIKCIKYVVSVSSTSSCTTSNNIREGIDDAEKCEQ